MRSPTTGLPRLSWSLQLSQGDSNLLSNALKHTDAGGTLAIACHEAGGNCAIVVSDTGCGIGPDELAKVFGIDKGGALASTPSTPTADPCANS